MLNKILFALGVVVIVSALGNALICQECLYTSQSPAASRKCDLNIVSNCSSNYCFTATYTDKNGIVAVIRACDDGRTGETFCPDAEKTCSNKTKNESLKACAGACCKTDKCNNYTPSTSSATGIMVTKFTLILMIIAALYV